MAEDSPNRWRSRRAFLRRAGLTGMGLVGAGIVAGGAIERRTFALTDTGIGRAPRPDDPRFTIAVIPDTQFLFDSDRGDPAPLAASLAYLVDRRAEDNIAFVAHLGDIVENAAADELRAAGRVFAALDRAGMPYSVLAGNHDIDARTDDQRGHSPYLDIFGPRRFAALPSFGGATPDGYNTCHRFRAAGRDWLLLALDWRPSDGTLAWARGVLRRHPHCPAILTTHELVAPEGDGSVSLPAHGRRLWDELIRDHDQVLLALNGHFWPCGRTVRRNAAGNDVHLHITNYQNRYYGGSGMIRLYRFDTARNTIDVRTLAPWLLARPAERRNPLQACEVELTDPRNAFSVPVDFTARFAGFSPSPAARALAGPVAGTVAHWRFPDGALSAVDDGSAAGNHLTPVALRGSPPCLGTGYDAPLNTMTFPNGYTVEAYVELPAGALRHRTMMGILTRPGAGADPLAALEVADGLALSWSAFPAHRAATSVKASVKASVNWSHELPVGRWCHLSVVNDGRHTVMYVDGAPVLRNPRTPAPGLATAGRPWLVGASHRGGALRWPFPGRLAWLRIVDRPLGRADFIARP
jgi:hypothetical protein